MLATDSRLVMPRQRRSKTWGRAGMVLFAAVASASCHPSPLPSSRQPAASVLVESDAIISAFHCGGSRVVSIRGRARVRDGQVFDVRPSLETTIVALDDNGTVQWTQTRNGIVHISRPCSTRSSGGLLGAEVDSAESALRVLELNPSSGAVSVRSEHRIVGRDDQAITIMDVVHSGSTAWMRVAGVRAVGSDRALEASASESAFGLLCIGPKFTRFIGLESAPILAQAAREGGAAAAVRSQIWRLGPDCVTEVVPVEVRGEIRAIDVGPRQIGVSGQIRELVVGVRPRKNVKNYVAVFEQTSSGWRRALELDVGDSVRVDSVVVGDKEVWMSGAYFQRLRILDARLARYREEHAYRGTAFFAVADRTGTHANATEVALDGTARLAWTSDSGVPRALLDVEHRGPLLYPAFREPLRATFQRETRTLVEIPF